MEITDVLFARHLNGGGGGDVTVVPLSVTSNGTYSEEGKAYSPVTVEVSPPEDSYQLKLITTPTSLATFEASAMPMPSLKVSVEAKQEGSGTPSPENVRPISGWSEVVVSDVGKNKINPNTLEIGYYNNNGEKINDDHYRMSALISAKSNTVYTTSLFVKDTKEYVGGLVTTCWDVNENIINQYTTSSFTTPPNTAYIRVRNFQSDSSYIMNDNFIYQLEEGSTATTYEPYNGTTTTISLPQTVYGAEVDVVNGGGNKKYHEIKFEDLIWTNAPTGTANVYRKKAELPISGKPVYNSQTLDAICSTYDAESANDTYSCLDGVSGDPTGNYIYVYDSEYPNQSDLTDFANARKATQLVYELATPTTLTTQPTPIKSLEGTNNLSVDCGDVIEGEYFIAL